MVITKDILNATDVLGTSALGTNALGTNARGTNAAFAGDGRTLPGDWTLERWQAALDQPSGDFVVWRGGSTVRVFLGDVSGHGDVAAAAAGDARAMIEAEAGLTIDAARLRSWSRRLLMLHPERFCCLTYVEIDLASRGATILNSGNPPVVVLRGGRRVEEYTSSGMPLAIIDDDEWEPPRFERLVLEADDVVVCMTDGVPDQTGRGRQRFGMGRVRAALLRPAGASPVRSLGSRVASFADRTAEQDDMTVVSIGAAARRAA